MTWLALTLGVAVLNLLLAELFDWFHWIAERVIARAARRLPHGDRERWETEWLAELDALPGKHLSHLLWASSIWLHAPSLSRALEHRPPLRAAVMKRALDITVSSALLVFLAPLMAVAALLIRLDSPGPVLFRQRRLGRDGRVFTLLKFRTMRLSASHTRGRGKIRQDPRVTRVGRFLRRYSMDELPQIFNVLRGEMSVAGSRPDIAEFRLDGEADRPKGIRPGLASWTSLAASMRIDMEEARRRDRELATDWSLRGELRLFTAVVMDVLVSGK
jgi:lipopolysaccharide/colanic/teichoic acid biosynthesis glycosyltransferase